jgi:hypothetical protein
MRVVAISRSRAPSIVALALLLSSCATAPALRCTAGQQAMIRESLYFGTAMPQGSVSPDAWQRFLADAVTPRFPDGFTVWPASGQWRGADGVIARESSYVLEILYDGSAEQRAAVDAIVRDYRERFQQEAVLRTSLPLCASFQ